MVDVFCAVSSAHRVVGVFSEPFRLPSNNGSTSKSLVLKIIALGVDGVKEGVAGDRPGVETVWSVSAKEPQSLASAASF